MDSQESAFGPGDESAGRPSTSLGVADADIAAGESLAVGGDELPQARVQEDSEKAPPVAAPLAPHLQAGPLPRPQEERPDYILVVPSYNRPKAFTEKTFRLVIEQKIPLDRVFVFVANEVAEGHLHDERTRYENMLCPLGLAESNIIVGVRGIMAQRNFIVRWAVDKFGPLKHVVSLDDDLEGLFYKERTHFDHRGAECGKLQEVEVGGLEAWIAHAAEAMRRTDSFIWCVNTSQNPYFMRCDTIGTGNGMCNGYFYGFRARADADLECIFMTATEDRERSIRYFAKDGIMLRYKMYTAKTKCFKNVGGIQDDYRGNMTDKNSARKVDERIGHQKIEEAFGAYYIASALKQKKSMQTMDGGFRRVSSRNAEFAHGLSCNLQPRKRGDGVVPIAERRPKIPRRSVNPDQEEVAPPCEEAVNGGESPSSPSSSTRQAASPSPKRPRLQRSMSQIFEGPTPIEAATPPTTASGLQEHEWPCLHCTFSNKPDASMCQICFAARESDLSTGTSDTAAESGPSVKHQAPASSDVWSCRRCTYENAGTSISCNVCGSIKQPDDDSSWICLRCNAYTSNDEFSCICCGLARALNKKGSFVCYIDSDSDREEDDDIFDIVEPKPDRAVVLGGASSGSDPEAKENEYAHGVSDVGGSWACTLCTFLNSKPEAPVCEVCGHQRESGAGARLNM